MTRRRSSRSRRQKVRLSGWSRVLFILGATVYVIGLLGGLRLMLMPNSTVVLLLAVGGGLLFAVMLSLVF